MKNQGVKITSVHPGSPADLAGIRACDLLLELNGHPLEDLLDLQFYRTDERVPLQVQRDGAILDLLFQASAGEDPGWQIEPLSVRSCRCNCIFCFVHQLPDGLRPALYVKDEDYRFSFLFGNYLTLVGLTSRHFERILRLKLSPLYISIHATDPVNRGWLLGLKRAPILPQLGGLIKGGIQIHGQIVLVPGWNDGRVLLKTLEDLVPLYPGLTSLSVVPVGLTEHRRNLESLRPLNRHDAGRALEVVRSFQKRMLKMHGRRWVFPADELLLKAGESFPSHEDYEDYHQIENGVGLVRWTIEGASQALDRLPSSLPKPRRLIWVTSRSASSILKSIADAFCSRIRGLHIAVVEAENHLLGQSVTVSGLLCGRDIASSLEKIFRSELPTMDASAVFLPPDCLNSDGLLLDDWTAADIADKFGAPVEVFDGSWDAMILGRNPSVSDGSLRERSLNETASAGHPGPSQRR